jgi:predicted ribosomally synthesized peptide with SipW-like signal peptide
MRDLKKIFLSLGAVAAIAALATGGTFAVFTDSESIASNDFDSGSVEVELNDSATPGPVITVSDLVIGDSKTGTLKVENVGDNKATFTLTGDASGSQPLEDAVHITINDGTTDVVDDVSLTSFNDGAGVNVGALSPGGSKTYTIDVSLPTTGSDAGDNLLQNLSGSETFNVDAVQRAGIDRDTDSTPED